MTSLELFRHDDLPPELYPEWGDGKPLGAAQQEDLWTPKPPSWHYTGRPTSQEYTLTKLKLSNTRLNDQLLPNPQHSDMHSLMIKLPFPANHPYASHIERKAVFPKFDSPSDPKRGVKARDITPKPDEMPAQPYDCIVINKVKGSGLRHELQALPPESQKKPLVWHEKNFDQLVKSPSGGQQEFYPWPPKVLVPNLEDRSKAKFLAGDMEVSERTATALRNVERDQWTTTYNRQHTGLGPSAPYSLDNLEEKRDTFSITQQDNDDLKPLSTNTLDPPRPQEGRIHRAFTQKPQPQTDKFPNPAKDPDYTPKPTRHEREEDRLWNGAQHNNYGADGAEYAEVAGVRTPATGLARLQAAQAAAGRPQDPPYQATGAPSGGEREEEQWREWDERARTFYEGVQQMEAANRWQELELQQPGNDLTALQHKMGLVSVKEQPGVFYDHEGKFLRERAGLYKTTYDPYAFQHNLDKKEKTMGELFDISECHKDALNLDVNINGDMHEAMRWSRTLGGPPGTVTQLHSQPTPYEALEPFKRHKQHQKSALQPNAATADVRTQERELVLQESTMGRDYNTPKFLQENKMATFQRNEPQVLMSHENQDLSKVRAASNPRGLSASLPLPRISSGEPAMSGSQTDRPHTTGFSQRYSYQTPEVYTARTSHPTLLGDRLPTATRQSLPASFPDQFLRSARGGAMSSAGQQGTNRASYESNPKHLDMSYKKDSSFEWTVGCGTPRPQTSLLKLQNDFVKSEVRKKFLTQFPEKNPDLRENHIRGRKHEFGGFNAQVLRGTPVGA